MELDPHIVILAAGPGKRMQSRRPKVMHEVLFRPMLHYVLDLAAALPHRSLSVVVGQGEAEIEASCRGYRSLRFFTQEVPLGTGHALHTLEPFLRNQRGPV